MVTSTTPRKPPRQAWKIGAPALLVSLMLAPELARAQSATPAPPPAPTTIAPEAPPPPPAATAAPPVMMPEPPPPVPPPPPAEVTVAPAPPPPEAPVAPAPPEAPVVAPSAHPNHAARARAYVLLGLGGASILVGTVFGLLAVSTKNDVFDNNPTYGEADAVRSQSLIADVGLGLGVILVATGTVYLLLDHPTPAATSPASTGAARVAAVRVEPVVGPHGGGGALTVRF
jgi:hypothetical protein